MSDIPIFDERVLERLNAELGSENTAEMLQIFLADTSIKMLAILRPGVSRSVVKREFHSIKSSAATFGFERLSRLARELEAGAETMEAMPLAASIAALEDAFHETSGFAESELLANLKENT